MSRISYTDEEDFPGQFGLWQSNCQRALHGRPGQAALRELEAALVALPTKRLIADDLDDGADCCAMGAVVRHRRLDPSEYDPEDMEGVGVELDMPRLVAWKVVEVNDHEHDYTFVRAPGPNIYYWPDYTPGYQLRVKVTPEERYEGVLAWVRSELALAARPA